MSSHNVCSKEVRRLAGGAQLSTFEAMALMRKVMMTSLSMEQLLSEGEGDEDDNEASLPETNEEFEKKEDD